MFVFPLIYTGAFLQTMYQLLKKRTGAILAFFICALPIYTTALSITNMYGLHFLIPVMQSFKEVIILIALAILLWNYRGPFHLHLVDKLMLFFFFYSLIYIPLPVGQFGLVEKLLAFKSLSFFVLVYFTGRLCDLRQIFLDKYFKVIVGISILASVVLLYEVLTYTHFQTMTGYPAYNYRYFNQEATGNYGLSWTFEVVDIGKSAKRFASFFSNPLEFAAATLLSLSVLAAMFTRQNNKLKVTTFGVIGLACTALSIFFALSRASMVSYFFLVYVYAFLTGKRKVIRGIHIFFLLAALYIIFFVNKDIREFVISTLNFSNLSSLGHVLEWLDGIQAMIGSPLGIGLGESGRIAGITGENVGGESQLIILGVQVGVVALGVYIAVYVILLKQAFSWFKRLRGKERRLSMVLLLIKTGFIVPMLTSNFESYIYLSYLTWFLSGLFIATIVKKAEHHNRAVPLVVAPGGTS